MLNIKQYKKKALVITVTALLFIIVITSLIIFTNKPEKKYQFLQNVDLASNYKNQTNFSLTNTFNIPKVNENYILKANTAINADLFKPIAFKLGYDKESINESEGIYAWSKSPEFNTSVLKYARRDRTLAISDQNGINTNSVTSDTAYDFLKDFLGFKLPEAEKYRESSISPVAKFLFYRIKKDNKIIYFDYVQENYLTVTLFNGKVTDLTMYVTPADFDKAFETAPLTSISSQNIDSVSYMVDRKTEAVASQSALGSESFSGGKFSASLKSSEEAYISYFNDITKESYLLPAFAITGDYLDDDNNRGQFLMVIFNQQN